MFQLGGIDLGVSTLGVLKAKMEDARDRNTIKDGRRAIDMAHYFVLLAEARDGLYQQIIQYIEINERELQFPLPMSRLFFTNTWEVRVSMKTRKLRKNENGPAYD